MKTAMQELLDITYRSISNAKQLQLNGLNNSREIEIMLNVYNFYIVIIERDMLEKEKEQIMMAFNEGKINSVLKKRDSLEYYNQTYNQNK
jgi:hypothetical protein